MSSWSLGREKGILRYCFFSAKRCWSPWFPWRLINMKSMIGGKAKCSHQQITKCLNVNWSVFMFICSTDRDHRPAVKAARLLIKSYRLLFILLDSKEYILSTFKGVRTRCFPNSIFMSFQKWLLKPKTLISFVRRRIVLIADEQSQPMSKVISQHAWWKTWQLVLPLCQCL